jgi:hypothetical protein
MTTPLLASEGTANGEEPRSKDGAALALKSPRRAARLFVEGAIRDGKGLSEFVIHFDTMTFDDAQLARLLWLLAISADMSPAERRDQRPRWDQVVLEPADLGRVLSPMVGAIDTRSGDMAQMSTRLADDLAGELEVQKVAPREPLVPWTTALVREGAIRIRELQGRK